MTELKNYNHAEQVTTPDDLKQSEQHGADRLNTQAELAESRIKTISVNRAGGGGLDEYFSGMEHHTWSEGTPWEISRLVNKRVFDVVGDVAGNYIDTLKGSSSAQFEGQMMKYTADDMIKQIQNTRANGLHDQETLQTLKGFTESAQEGVKNQIEDMKTKQQEMIAARGWWSKSGHKALAIGTLGTYNLVKTEKRQKWYNKHLEKSVTKQFDKINKNIETLEKRAGKQVAPEQSRIRRTLEATSDPVEKAAFKKELMDAVKNTGTDLSTVNLNAKWGVTTPQGKVNFLAAAKDLDFVKKDLGIISVSEGKQKQQEEMIDSAQKQQDVMNTPAKFEEIKGKLEGDGLVATEAAPSITDLVNNLTNDLSSAKVDIEGIYGADVTKVDLLTDTVRLMKLVDHVAGMSDDDRKKKLQLKTQQGLLAWIEKMDGDTGTTLKEKTVDFKAQEKGVNKQNKTLKTLNKEAVILLAALEGRKVGDGESEFKDDLQKLKDFSKKFFSAKQEFDDFKIENGETIPSKYTLAFEDSWGKLEKTQKFLLGSAESHKKNRDNYDKLASEMTKLGVDVANLKTVLTTAPVKDIISVLNQAKSDLKANEKIVEIAEKDYEKKSRKHEEAAKKYQATKGVGFGAGGDPALKIAQDQAATEKETSLKKLDGDKKVTEGHAKILRDKELDLTGRGLLDWEKQKKDLDDKLTQLGNTQKKIDLNVSLAEFTNAKGVLDALEKKNIKWIEKGKDLKLDSINNRITQSLRVDNFADELDKKFVSELEKNDQFEQLKGVSKGTKVSIMYKETSATNLRFPDQLNGTTDDFVVVESNDAGVLLEKVGTDGKTISILGPVAKGGSAYKNAKVASTSGSYSGGQTTTSGAWSSAVAYNFKIAA